MHRGFWPDWEAGREHRNCVQGRNHFPLQFSCMLSCFAVQWLVRKGKLMKWVFTATFLWLFPAILNKLAISHHHQEAQLRGSAWEREPTFGSRGEETKVRRDNSWHKVCVILLLFIFSLMFDILVVVVLVDIVVVAVVEQERQRRWDKSPSKRFPAQCVFFSSIFAVCIVVDIAIVVVEGLECWSGQNHVLDKFSEMEMSKSWCFDVLQLWPLPSTFQHSFVTWQVRHVGVQCSKISMLLHFDQ